MSKELGTIAYISASWHGDIVGIARENCTSELATLGFDTSKIDEFAVPGSLEIPLFAQKLAATGKYSAIIAFGFVVNGGIYRHDFVASAVIDGMMRVQLDSGVPVFSTVLTPHHFHSHEDHEKFFKEHMVHKGQEVARSCVSMLEALAKI